MPTISNAAAWHAAGEALKARFAGTPNLYVTTADGGFDFFDPARTALAEPTTEASGVFYGDSLTIMVLSDTYAVDLALVPRLRAQYPRFAGYRVVIYIDSEFLGRIAHARPAAAIAFRDDIETLCADLADCGFRFGGLVTYLAADPAPFIADVLAAWPGLG